MVENRGSPLVVPRCSGNPPIHKQPKWVFIVRIKIFFVAIFIATSAFLGCDKSESAKEDPGHVDKKSAAKPLSLSQVKPLFPKEVGGFEVVKIQVKALAAHSSEYNSTYKPLRGPRGIIKLIIHDERPDGRPAWKKQMGKSTQSTKGYPSYVAKKGNKITRMVFVAKRFRIDFKSRDFGLGTLDQLANAFDYAALVKLGSATGR
jgi:hypothetical protein